MLTLFVSKEYNSCQGIIGVDSGEVRYEGAQMTEYEQAVFISYAWGAEREEIVNQLDQTLQKRGVRIIRDKRDLGYKGSISEFMERIGQGNCVIVVISDKYLRSPNCMFELVEIAEGKQFHDRIFPIVLGDANIYDPIKRIEYVRYWEVKRAELAEAMKTLDPANLQGIRDDMDLYDRIRDKVSGLSSILKDMNTLTPDMHRDADFNEVYDGIVKRMQDTNAASSTRSSADEKPATKKERKPMDPITLATAATTLLAPYISKVGEKVMDKIAEQLPEKIGAVWNAIQDRLFKDKPLVAAAASDLVKNAEDIDNQESFARELRKALKDLKDDEGFASQLTDLIEQAKSEAGISNVGDGVVATNGGIGNAFKVGGSVSGSTINISSDIQSNDNPARSKK
jgi:hypothetical protein